MGCCEEWKTDCDQGRNCPGRTRRVRAGGPPPDDLPIQYADEEPPDFTNVAIAIVVLTIIFLIVAIAFRHYL